MAQKPSASYPGMKPAFRAPAPPKFLLVTDSSGKEEKIEVATMNTQRSASSSSSSSSSSSAGGTRSTMLPVRIKQPENQMIQTKFTSVDAMPKSFDQPPHQFKRSVDSKSEGKSADCALPLRYVGNTYVNTPNAPSRGFVPLPRSPAIPRPYVPDAPSAFHGKPMLNNRTISGAILGSSVTIRPVDAAHVPYLEPEKPIGPDNPSKQLDPTWSGHWDGEAGAVYYYNQITGEATWIPPF